MTIEQQMIVPVLGAQAQMQRFELLTQNLANIGTVGYKAEVGLFETILVDLAPDASQPLDTQPLTVSVERLVGRAVDYSAGPIRRTGAPYDLALLGEGFFTVVTPDGVRYTRRGRFALDGQGQLITSEGYLVQGTQGEIVLDGNRNFSVDSKGAVSNGGATVDSLQVVTFADPSRLERLSNGMFTWPGLPAEVTQVDEPNVVQGSLEMSNVNPLVGMTQMITVLRSYEATVKSMSALTEAQRRAVNDIATLTA